MACSGLAFERDPMPDAEPWRAIENPSERLRVRTDDRLTEIERGKQRVHEAAGPGPVGRRPEEISFTRITVVRMDEPRQIAKETPVRHQSALGRPGRAAGVDEKRRIARARRHGVKVRRCPLEQRLIRRDPCLARPGDADDMGDSGTSVANPRELGCDWGSTKAILAAQSFNRYSSASGPNRNDNGTATAPNWYVAMCATTVSGRWGRISAILSPRSIPMAASALDRRFARCCKSQNVYARRAPDSSSQYSAKRERSFAQRAQQACPMLNSAGTFQRCAATISWYRSAAIRPRSVRRPGADVELRGNRVDDGPDPIRVLFSNRPWRIVRVESPVRSV